MLHSKPSGSRPVRASASPPPPPCCARESGVTSPPMKPSASRPARRTAGSAKPPIQIGGPPRAGGLGGDGDPRIGGAGRPGHHAAAPGLVQDLDRVLEPSAPRRDRDPEPV